MIRFLASCVLGLLLSFGYTTFFRYQVVNLSSVDLFQMLGLTVIVLLCTGASFFLSFWNLAGFPRKPVSWKYFETQGIPYNLTRDNLNFLIFICVSFGFFALLSLGADFLLLQNLGTTMKGVFYNNGAAELIEFSYYWDRVHSYLYLAFYLGSVLCIVGILHQAFHRRGESEVAEPDRETREEDQ